MKILLVVAPSYFKYQPIIPIGVLYIADSLKKYCYEYDIIDLNFYTDTINALICKIENYCPDVIGISIRNIAETSETNDIYDRLHIMVETAKKYAKVILGGAGFSIFSKIIMEITGADYGIAGSGEEAIIHIIRDFRMITLGSVVSGDDKFIDSDISMTFNSYWNKYGKYFILSDTAIPIQSTRGCNLNCRYCSYPSLTKNKVQKRSISTLINEIRSIINYTKRKKIYFVDAIFNLDLRYTKAVLKAIIDSRLDISFGCCINPLNYDSDLINMLKKAGCTYCEVGVDSFSDSQLKNLMKGFDKNQSKDLISQLENKKIPYSLCLVLGGVGENEETLEETICTANKYSEAKINAFIGERVYPRTPLAKKMNIDNEELLLKATKDSIYIEEKLIRPLNLLVRESDPLKWSFAGNLFEEKNYEN